MNTTIIPFEFNTHQVRSIIIGNEPWFVAKDVCDVLDLANITEALRGLDDEDKQQLPTNIINPEVGGRGTLVVNESGLYTLILRSRKPEAKVFKKWVTSEVLPSIRKEGGYIATIDAWKRMTSPESIIRLAEQMQRLELEGQAKDRMLKIQSSKLEGQELMLESQKPMVEYAETTLQSDGSITTTIIAAELGMTANKLNRLLKEEGVIYKVNGTWVLTAKHKNYGYMETNYKTIDHTDGSQEQKPWTTWTQKGRYFVLELMREKYDIYPRSETLQTNAPPMPPAHPPKQPNLPFNEDDLPGHAQ